jgi:hypothetical protein
MRPFPSFPTLLFLAAAGMPASAQFIHGRVLDPLGAPVAGVNINAENNGSGGDPDLFNDGTNALGFFTTTVDPAGTYDFVFIPPSGGNLTVVTLADLTVPALGTLELGDVTLPFGAVVTGTVRDQAGLPLNAVNLDVLDPATGDQLYTPGDMTDATGAFSIVVPFGTWDLTFSATAGTGAGLLAPKLVNATFTANTGLGTVTLVPGFTLSATVLKPNLTGVLNADLDLFETAGGAKLYTPGDNTNAAGFVDVVVPAGTFDVEIAAPFANKLVSKTVAGVVVAGTTSLGIHVLQAGQILQGSVTNGANQPLAGVDVDVFVSSTGLEVTLSGDNTSATGTYAVIVPGSTTIDVEFEPPYSLPYGSQTVLNVPVTTVTKVQNGVLPDLPFHVPYGVGLAGSGGVVPLLGSSGGAPRFGNPDWALELSGALGGTTSVMLVGFGPASLPFKQGTLLVDIFGGPGLMIFLPVFGTPGAAGAGFFTLPAPVPTEPLYAGLTWYSQFLVQDPGAPAGWAMTNGVAVTWLP